MCRGLKILRKVYDRYQHVKDVQISTVVSFPFWSLKETGICAAKSDFKSCKTELMNVCAAIRVSWGLGRGFSMSPCRWAQSSVPSSAASFLAVLLDKPFRSLAAPYVGIKGSDESCCSVSPFSLSYGGNSGCIPSAYAHKPACSLVKLAALLRAEAWHIERERTKLSPQTLGLALIYGY